MRKLAWIAIFLMALVVASGCASNKELITQQEQEIAELQGKVSSLETELAAEKKRSSELNSELEGALSEYQAKEQVLLEKIDNKSVITVSEAMMFSSGGVQLTQNATEMLDAVVEVLGRYPDREIRIEGHTDNVGIALEFQGQFKSNWELSTARATSVLHYLRRKHDLDPGHVAAVGYGEYRPVASNDTPEGRSSNRRVVIEVGPKL
jgi:chemotaxis protein MotB